MNQLVSFSLLFAFLRFVGMLCCFFGWPTNQQHDDPPRPTNRQHDRPTNQPTGVPSNDFGDSSLECSTRAAQKKKCSMILFNGLFDSPRFESQSRTSETMPRRLTTHRPHLLLLTTSWLWRKNSTSEVIQTKPETPGSFMLQFAIKCFSC